MVGGGQLVFKRKILEEIWSKQNLKERFSKRNISKERFSKQQEYFLKKMFLKQGFE